MHENAIFSPINGGGGGVRRVRPMLDPPLHGLEPCVLLIYGNGHTQQAQNICKTFVQRRPNVFDLCFIVKYRTRCCLRDNKIALVVRAVDTSIYIYILTYNNDKYYRYIHNTRHR